jgi:DNA invertase Pin-like site-specific DNA recombinase
MIQLKCLKSRWEIQRMVIGYARVSTQEQCLDRQTDAINKSGAERIYTEKMSGVKSCRPELDKVREIARQGDTLIIESLSRLGRSTKDLLALLDEFQSKGVKVISLKENVDSTTPTGKLLTTVLSAISQFERDVIVQRTSEGLQAARARGRKGGRPKANPKSLEKAVKLYNSQTHSIREIVTITKISQATLYRALAESKQQ